MVSHTAQTLRDKITEEELIRRFLGYDPAQLPHIQLKKQLLAEISFPQTTFKTCCCLFSPKEKHSYAHTKNTPATFNHSPEFLIPVLVAAIQMRPSKEGKMLELLNVDPHKVELLGS